MLAVDPSDYIPQLVTWSTFNLFATCALLALLVVTLLQQGLQANAMLINLEIIFILTSSSGSALIWTGHARDQDPPFGLCLWNASSVLANAPLMAGAALSIVTQVWGTAMTLWHPRCSPVMKWLIWTPFLLALPFTFGAPVFLAAIGLGLRNKALVHRGSPFYCLLDISSLQILSTAFGAGLTFTSLVLASWTSVKLLITRRRFGSTRFSEHSNISHAFVLRVILFSGFIAAAFVSGIVALSSTFDALIPDIVVASCGAGAFFIFASSRPILRFVFFCKRDEVRSGNHTLRGSLSASRSGSRSGGRTGHGGSSTPGRLFVLNATDDKKMDTRVHVTRFTEVVGDEAGWELQKIA